MSDRRQWAINASERSTLASDLISRAKSRVAKLQYKSQLKLHIIITYFYICLKK